MSAVSTDEPDAMVSGVADVARVAGTDAVDGAALLRDVEAFLTRFVAYPSKQARVAHVLWIAHTWLIDKWDSTPRLAFLSPEPGSRKSRALEVTGPLVPRPVHAVNVSPSYLFHSVSRPDGKPTILYDEIDTLFGPKAKGNEEIRGLLNAGHRNGAVAGRCVMRGETVETRDFPAYCAVALAGLRDLPDTVRTRAVVIGMRRRAPGEKVEPYRPRATKEVEGLLHERLRVWAESVDHVTYPEMPEGVEDRNADVWESLLAVAYLAGENWPARAEAAAVHFVCGSHDETPSMGVQLLRDLLVVFGSQPKMSTTRILVGLASMPESPWGNYHRDGSAVNALDLSKMLKPYGVKSRDIREGQGIYKGYLADDLADPWSRYVEHERATPQEVATSAT